MEAIADEIPHALVVPFPAQGHINPMMHLARKLASDRFLVSFVNTDYNRSRMMQATNKMIFQDDDHKIEGVRMLSIPDGLPPDASRADLPKVMNAVKDTLGPSLHKLIQHINQKEKDKITCLIFDLSLHYARQVAMHYDLPYAFFCPASVAAGALCHLGSTLVSSGIVSPNGSPKVHKVVKAHPLMAPLHSTQFTWMFGSEAQIPTNFQSALTIENELRTGWMLFNSFDDLEGPLIQEYPEKGIQTCPIGPLVPWSIPDGDSGRRQGTWPGALWAEDVECLDWLQKQARQSVVYVSFGSLAVLNEKQFLELALGLEATGRPFLWVVRCDLLDGTAVTFPPGFVERVGDRGCLVSWAPQVSVLSHPSIACFITHCGWNSVMESISMGIPMLCWPYFIDQFLNCSYVVNEWRIGFQLIANKDGIIEKGEIVNAVEKLIGEEGDDPKNRVTKLQESARAAVKEGGSSSVNYNRFVEAMRTRKK